MNCRECAEAERLLVLDTVRVRNDARVLYVTLLQMESTIQTGVVEHVHFVPHIDHVLVRVVWDDGSSTVNIPECWLERAL